MQHIPVMKNEVANFMNIRVNGIYVDMTLGFGGHSREILKLLNNTGHLYGVDQDLDAINYCNSDPLFTNATNFTILHMNFSDFKNWSVQQGINSIDGCLFDLGVSSYQIDHESRGFSYIKDGELDMRMNQQVGRSAKQALMELDFKQLVHIFRKYGQINHPQRVAKAIVSHRGKINSTKDLVNLINQNTPAVIRYQKNVNRHIEKKYFMALRIYLNDELNLLEQAVANTAKMLSKNGRMVIIAYHSLEIQSVKKSLASLVEKPFSLDIPLTLFEPDFCWITKKAITPSVQEIQDNPRSHSARLLCLERIK